LRPYKYYILFAIWITCLGLLSSACGLVSPKNEPTLTASPSLAPTVTPIPTLTPTPTPLPLTAVLLAPAGADDAKGRLQTALNDIVTAHGLRWQIRQQLSPQDLVPELRLVVAVPPDPGIAQLAAAAPDTQFLALGIPELEAAPNLSVIDAIGDRPDQQGFIAGVIAAMLAPDWRAGVISLSDTVDGRSARTGFLNGVEYFCGLCRPLNPHPPFYEYPLYFELPLTATSAEWQEAANYMVDHAVGTVYVGPQAGDETMLSILAQAGVNIIGNGEPPANVTSSWVVSMSTDPLAFIQEQVAGLLDGNLTGGQSLVVPIQFTNINPATFTPGKQRLAQQTLSDLQTGYIDTGVDLTTGEKKP
jgi:hypothetical protein